RVPRGPESSAIPQEGNDDEALGGPADSRVVLARGPGDRVGDLGVLLHGIPGHRHGRGRRRRRLGTTWSVMGANHSQEGKTMTKLWAVLVILVSFLLVAAVIESGTSGYFSTVFGPIGTAGGGGG